VRNLKVKLRKAEEEFDDKVTTVNMEAARKTAQCELEKSNLKLNSCTENGIC